MGEEDTDLVAKEWEQLAVGLGRLRRELVSQAFGNAEIDMIIARCLEYYLQSRYRDGMSFPMYNGMA